MNALALIGDIGGTHTRLALAVEGRCEHSCTYLNAANGRLEEALDDYLATQGLLASELDLLLAVAAPVNGECVRLTNLDWTIDAPALRARYGFRRAGLRNDFAAVAAAVPALRADERLAIGGGRALADAPALVLGPGTGFGASLWLPPGQVIATEAGHALLAPVDDVEAAVLERMRRTYGPISIEHVLSGAGLVRLYAAVAGATAAHDDPAAIAEAARGGHDTAAVRAFALFFALLGIAARNLALATGARGGVYLAGGILPRYPAELAASSFRARFETPAPLPGYLAGIPVWLITHPEPALLGLAQAAQGARGDTIG